MNQSNMNSNDITLKSTLCNGFGGDFNYLNKSRARYTIYPEIKASTNTTETLKNSTNWQWWICVPPWLE